MTWLLDTNVVSEWVKPQPDTGVIRWLAEADEGRVFISVVTLAELRYGIDRMPAGARRRRLEHWLAEDLADRFDGRILGVDAVVSDQWGRFLALGEKQGRPIGPMDACLAAIAAHHGLTLVTRNDKDFAVTSIPLLNPWDLR